MIIIQPGLYYWRTNECLRRVKGISHWFWSKTKSIEWYNERLSL